MGNILVELMSLEEKQSLSRKQQIGIGYAQLPGGNRAWWVAWAAVMVLNVTCIKAVSDGFELLTVLASMIPALLWVAVMFKTEAACCDWEDEACRAIYGDAVVDGHDRVVKESEMSQYFGIFCDASHRDDMVKELATVGHDPSPDNLRRVVRLADTLAWCDRRE